MSVNNSPFMNLPVPAVGIEPGPQWASDINNSLTIIDSHNHSPGSGVQITPTGLNINIDLPFNAHSATSLMSVQFVSQASAISALASVYVQGNELFYNDLSGNHVQLTKTGSPNAGTGNISGLVSPASASYSSSTFVFQSNANTSANLDAGSILLRLPVANSPALTLAPPSSMTTGYSITLPALPAVASVVTIDTSGNMAAQPLVQLLPPPGTISMYGGTTAPAGYLFCDGAAVSRTTYSALYSSIGNNFGYGDNSTTFNVPDMRGYFPRGGLLGLTGAPALARDPDYTARTALNTGGNTAGAVGSFEADAFAAHAHSLPFGQIGISGNNIPGPVNGGPSYSSGLAGGSETRPKNVYVNFIIKT